MTDFASCKRCLLPINEGHAYELGTHRWHIACFSCSKCDNALGTNSNFLVLGNGSLICSNCSYNCKQCSRKIDDLAILTGDYAYCTSCFKCRACKNKIEDLKYARTSKGLFCMSCHEKLLKKKRSKNQENQLKSDRGNYDLPSTPELPNQPEDDHLQRPLDQPGRFDIGMNNSEHSSRESLRKVVEIQARESVRKFDELQVKDSEGHDDEIKTRKPDDSQFSRDTGRLMDENYSSGENLSRLDRVQSKDHREIVESRENRKIDDKHQSLEVVNKDFVEARGYTQNLAQKENLNLETENNSDILDSYQEKTPVIPLKSSLRGLNFDSNENGFTHEDPRVSEAINAYSSRESLRSGNTNNSSPKDSNQKSRETLASGDQIINGHSNNYNNKLKRSEGLIEEYHHVNNENDLKKSSNYENDNINQTLTVRNPEIQTKSLNRDFKLLLNLNSEEDFINHYNNSNDLFDQLNDNKAREIASHEQIGYSGIQKETNASNGRNLDPNHPNNQNQSNPHRNPFNTDNSSSYLNSSQKENLTSLNGSFSSYSTPVMKYDDASNLTTPITNRETLRNGSNEYFQSIPNESKTSTRREQTTNSNRVSNDFSIEEVNDSDNEEIPMKRAPSLRQGKSQNASQLQKLSGVLKSDSKDGRTTDSETLINTMRSPVKFKPKSNPGSLLNSPVDLTFKTPNLSNPEKSRDTPVSLTLSPNNKNILLLSPNQFHDNEFHNAAMTVPQKMDLDALEPPNEDNKRQNNLSPFARSNRQARVVESNDFTSNDLLTVDLQGADVRDNFSNRNTVLTPKKKPISSEFLSSPPPRLPLPSTPSSKTVSTTQPKHEETPKGLGLEGIDFYNEQLQSSFYDYEKSNPSPIKKRQNHTQAVTNLEDLSEQKAEDSNTISRTNSSIKTAILGLLKHKRSISGGSGSLANKFGFFRSNREERGHGRHVSESSINEISHSVPLGTSPYPRQSPRNHSRSFSDTGVASIEQSIMVENLQLLKDEVSQLSKQKKLLDMEVKRLANEKTSIFEQNRILQTKLTTFEQEREVLNKELEELRKQKDKLIEINQSLSEQNQTLIEQNHSIEYQNSSTSTLPMENIRKIPSESSNSSVHDQEDPEPQRAARLKFWRRKGNNPNPATMNEHKYDKGKGSNELRVEENKFVKSRSINALDQFLINKAGLYSSTIQQRADYENTRVPTIVTKCIEEVERRGLDTEGIYRISGGNSAIVAIENAFSSETDYHDVISGDINAVTSALKRYLRKLPDPLISYNLYDEYIRVTQISDLKQLISRLPPANRHTLQLLCKHLTLINSYSSINRMGYKNLSVVFAPTIARDKTGEREMVDMGNRNNTTELLLTNAEILFG